MLDGRLQIPTKKLMVEVALDGGYRRSIMLFLAAHDQNLMAFLERNQQFLPAQDDGARAEGSPGGWSIINKRAIQWASVALVDGRLPIEEDSGEAELYDCRAVVRIEFADGDPIIGEVLYSPRSTQSRLTDHLNLQSRFFRVWSASALYLVNKDQMVRVIETTEPNEAR